MKRFSNCILILPFLIGCVGPEVVVGPDEPNKLEGYSRSISASFGPEDTRELHRRITTSAFRETLKKYTCGYPVPQFDVTVAFWPERTGVWAWRASNERILLIYTDPTLGVRPTDMCVMIGFSYEVDRVLFQMDQGPPIDYKIKDPLTGKILPPQNYRETLMKPVCDCSKRNSNELWVDIVEKKFIPEPREP